VDTVTRQSRCERGVGNDPIIITGLKKVGEVDTIDSLYLFIDTRLGGLGILHIDV